MKQTLISLIPVLVLVVLLGFDISIFGSDSILGASQVVLLIAAGICVWLGVWLFKTPWKVFEDAIGNNIGEVTSAIIILFMIGAISGTWTISGIIPTLIYYGIQIISPRFFLVTACVICAIVSVMIGSSWTTIATVGLALLGIGKAEGFSDAITAGAIISGAYFGDKISPLSDTTVLASSVSGTPLFEHIRYMLYTTVPSIVITLVIFTILGFTHDGAAPQINIYTDTLQAHFNITPWLLIVPVITGVMIVRKLPALVVLGLSVMLAAVFAGIFQGDIVRTIGSQAALTHDVTRTLPGWQLMLAGSIETIYNSVSIDTGVAQVNELLTSRGMTGMLNTVYLVFCAMCFGACMRASGMIGHLARAMNTLVCEQYLSIILTSNVYREIYEKAGYENRLLSRTIEDSATVTSPLIPWSSCGMTQATILNTPTLTYLPYCFFNIISPLMSLLIAGLGYKIFRREVPEEESVSASK